MINMNTPIAEKEGLSIIIPVYNEERAIRRTLIDLQETLDHSGIQPYEILVINDSSCDHTDQEIQAANIPCRIITHKSNKGYGASIKTGLRHACYNTIAITDADGTYPNQKIPDLYAHYRQQQLNMVVGARTGKNVTYPFIKKIPKFFILALANYIAGTKIPDINSGLRIFDKPIALKFFNLYPDGFSFTITITMSMLCRGYDVDYMAIDYFTRTGVSKISPIKDTLEFFSLLSKIAVFFNPMKLFMPFVGLLALISLAFMIKDVFIVHNLSQSSVLFPILTVMIFFMSLIADMISKK
ncbi:glycosyl transferase, group 2 family domain protein [Candidatus Vecturithrix granuli]|uniref:Glycosyl transferase, group 2 family domain protein n=1 Tax=Vecturithrix granuli TaxID=1499967 RepID=A0A081C790_VECG1|nr:glycosyl transferase, group 2 family domain protein [Candidatus Vecturithrix granuli]